MSHPSPPIRTSTGEAAQRWRGVQAGPGSEMPPATRTPHPPSQLRAQGLLRHHVLGREVPPRAVLPLPGVVRRRLRVARHHGLTRGCTPRGVLGDAHAHRQGGLRRRRAEDHLGGPGNQARCGGLRAWPPNHCPLMPSLCILFLQPSSPRESSGSSATRSSPSSLSGRARGACAPGPVPLVNAAAPRPPPLSGRAARA